MGFRCLGRDCNIGAIASCAQRNGETNSARAAADKDGFASQRPVHCDSLRLKEIELEPGGLYCGGSGV